MPYKDVVRITDYSFKHWLPTLTDALSLCFILYSGHINKILPYFNNSHFFLWYFNIIVSTFHCHLASLWHYCMQFQTKSLHHLRSTWLLHSTEGVWTSNRVAYQRDNPLKINPFPAENFSISSRGVWISHGLLYYNRVWNYILYCIHKHAYLL